MLIFRKSGIYTSLINQYAANVIFLKNIKKIKIQVRNIVKFKKSG